MCVAGLEFNKNSIKVHNAVCADNGNNKNVILLRTLYGEKQGDKFHVRISILYNKQTTVYFRIQYYVTVELELFSVVQSNVQKIKAVYPKFVLLLFKIVFSTNYLSGPSYNVTIF